MGVYIHYGLALDVRVAKRETEECRATPEDVIRETGKHHDIGAYELRETPESFQFTARPEIVLDRLGTLLSRFKELSASMEDKDWTALFQLDWPGQTLESLQAIAKMRENYHFQEYYNAEPQWSGFFSFRERFSIWHTGILIDMEEGKVRTEGMDRTLDLTTRLLRSALADLPPSRYLKVFLNM
jgi:hypothetical protein